KRPGCRKRTKYALRRRMGHPRENQKPLVLKRHLGRPVAPIRVSIFFMEVTVKIPDELAARAKSRGLRVEDYVQEILREQLGPQRLSAPQARTPEEIRAWLDSLAQFSDKIPPLPENITRSEEHTSELQSRGHLVCRLLLEKKKKIRK